jgi:hypothetical protein
MYLYIFNGYKGFYFKGIYHKKTILTTLLTIRLISYTIESFLFIIHDNLQITIDGFLLLRDDLLIVRYGLLIMRGNLLTVRYSLLIMRGDLLAVRYDLLIMRGDLLAVTGKFLIGIDGLFIV